MTIDIELLYPYSISVAISSGTGPYMGQITYTSMWRNFLNTVTGDQRAKTRLDQYNAIFFENSVRFSSEQDMILFLIKFS
jgi:hypothetical protein